MPETREFAVKFVKPFTMKGVTNSVINSPLMFSRWTEVDVALRALLTGADADSLESETLDFKEDDRRSQKDLIKTITDAVLCFANNRGGYVVIGVDDDSCGPAAVTGTGLDVETVRRRVYELTTPPLLVDSDSMVVEGQTVLALHVPASIDIHSDTHGRVTRRIGKDCIPLNPDAQHRLREERRGVDSSERPTEAPHSDPDALALDTARRQLRALTDERQSISGLNDADLMRALGVMNEKGQLLRAGEVLFCSSPGHPKIVYQYRATSGSEPVVVERLDGPLILVFQRAMELVRARLEITPVTLPTGQQISIENFPELVVREALSNAVFHRDLHVDAPVTIEHSADSMIISSPGPLVAGVTTDNILIHPPKPRNHALARAARTLGLAEELGRGVVRMYREMVRSGKQVPSIQDEFDHVRVVLTGAAPNAQIARYVRQLPENEQQDVDAMLVLVKLCAVPRVNASQMSRLLQRTEEETETILRRLSTSDVDMIEPTRETARRARPQYRLTQSAIRALGAAAVYHRATLGTVDTKVAAHLKEYGTITNKTVQNLLDVDMLGARRILTDLVRRGVLIKISEQQRGPGVEYGPGDKFPTGVTRTGAVGKRSRTKGEHRLP